MSVHMPDDVSSLGGDWDHQSHQSKKQNSENPEDKRDEENQGDMGDLDEDDINAMNQKYAEDHGYVVDGFECPHEFLTILAPMEFEELVTMFKTYDANGSGTIDRHEARKILLNLGMDASLEKAEELLAIVDVDGSGEIDFEEFCRFIVMVKQGDERLSSFQDLLTQINNTPLGALEHQAKLRELKLKFVTLEEREATAFNPPLFVVEIHITGFWHSIVNGAIESKFEVKRFQGLGKSIREAKYSAASAAILKLGDMMPGVKYKEGEIPPDWLEWINENLHRGVEPSVIMKILATKGFHPYRNLYLMHRILAWKSFDYFLEKNPGFVYDEETCDDVHFRKWVVDIANRGFDGEVVLEVLFDRNVDMVRYNPYLGQKLRNNELGTLMDKNGISPELLDFWIASAKGYVDDVEIYCSCQAPVNEEAPGRHSGEYQRPISLAAAGGHDKVVKILIDYKADVNAIDRRGRNALHLAAMHGKTEACRVLLDHGGKIFAGDFEGNTPLHLAAMGNHLSTVNLLASKALEFTRSITSDRVRPRPTATFNQLVEELFDVVCSEKLHPSDTKRFEKDWLSYGANRFIELMDPSVQYMLAKGYPDIQVDVLNRFDPRPETGIFVLDVRTATQVFVPTIPSPTELAMLLRYMFRQSALDSLNRLKRSPLHMAADANRIDSHTEVIRTLIDTHGSNLFLHDIHNRRPIDLLVLDRYFGDSPSATQIKEELVNERRTNELEKLSEKFNEEERIRTENRRNKIMTECVRCAENCSPDLWEIVREGSTLRYEYHMWQAYEDPESLNLFYVKAPENILKGDKYSEYTWRIPPLIAKAVIDKRVAILYLTRIRSTLQRKVAQWECYRCNITGMDFYYNPNTDVIRYTTPRECEWSTLQKFATFVEKLGYGNEWDCMKDQYRNTFYRHNLSRRCFWDRPTDAVKASPSEKFCTAFQMKGRSIEQLWYTCEECNRSWKSSDEGAKIVLKLCEPCVFRCHKGHKGIRPMRTAMSLCNCIQIGKVVGCACHARVISEQQTRVQGAAFDMRLELNRRKEHNTLMPPMFAMVPPRWPDGKRKTVSGWMLCRRPPPKTVDNKLPDKFGGIKKSFGDSVGEDIINEEEQGPQHDSDSDIDPENPEEVHEDDAATVDTTVTGSIVPGQPASIKLVNFLSQRGEDQEVLACNQIEGLSSDWMEVMDVEEKEIIDVGSRVLVAPITGPIRVYATVTALHRPGFYRVVYDTAAKFKEDIIARPRLEVVSKQIFYFNRVTSESAWSIEDAVNRPFSSAGLQLPGNEWMSIYDRSRLRRVFHSRDELACDILESLFYVDLNYFQQERAARMLQRFFRNRKRMPLPNVDWPSFSFSFDPPEDVLKEMVEAAGWAYLRRRSNNIGEFKDGEGVEWEEYIDRETSEYFYWTEDENFYQWDKPPLPNRKRNAIELLKVGEEVLYRFPGRRIEEIAVIAKVRFDDQTGADMYDVASKYLENYVCKWVHRMELKQPPMEGDALMLKKLESSWVKQIRRKNESDERRRKKERERRMQEEVERLKTLKTLALTGSSGANDNKSKQVGDMSRIMRGRMLRITQEYQDVKLEKERADTLRRHLAVKDEIERIKRESSVNLSRADILSLTRSLDLRLRMQDRVEKRNILQIELNERKEQTIKRIIDSEVYLRNMEVTMTSPRSLRRRKVVRHLHFGMRRQEDRFMICEWGCGDWVRVGYDQMDHQSCRCTKRIIACTLGCPKKMAEEDWLRPYQPPTQDDIDEKALTEVRGGPKIKIDDITVQQYHETEECPKRLVCCPRQCLEWVCFEVLQNHLDNLCTRRPAKPIYCRLGCNAVFGGIIEKLIEAEDERLMHETEQCEYRIVRCNWKFDDGRFCAAQMMAKDRDEHRDYHLALMGITTYLVPGTYIFKVPRGVYRIKIQAWGAGGGSGFFLDRQGGAGGGGAFVEVILNVDPYDTLEVVVGSGGHGGAVGTEIQAMDLDLQRIDMAERRKREMFLPKDQRDTTPLNAEVIDGTCGVALGGNPGGGEGYGGGGCWAAGGGGGYTIISKRTNKGNQALVIAAGGGGGSSLSGLPGGGMEGSLPGTSIDTINGETATAERPGHAGDSGTAFNSKWPATDGAQWQGGNGSEFGAGGGGGYFGGGGGGTMPGIGGGGGGGASYVYLPKAHDVVFVLGEGAKPGGLQHDIPDAVGLGEWDKVGGLVGQGGAPSKTATKKGNNGAVRIFKPGHY